MLDPLTVLTFNCLRLAQAGGRGERSRIQPQSLLSVFNRGIAWAIACVHPRPRAVPSIHISGHGTRSWSLIKGHTS